MKHTKKAIATLSVAFFTAGLLMAGFVGCSGDKDPVLDYTDSLKKSVEKTRKSAEKANKSIQEMQERIEAMNKATE